MNVAEIIRRKRDGLALTGEEIRFCVRHYTDGTLPDYQMSALAMAIYLRGMDAGETAELTEAMLRSGRQLQWGPGPPVADKHSTGGVGDKVSLILAPLLAACGLRVPMISGRGLGPTGGTLDKLESIPGFRTDLDEAELRRVVDEVGCAITGATAAIAPADRKLYALRDVTATVASMPLITASIMSKKLAENPQALVLDVKYGSGAFMKTQEQARQLAQSLVDTGQRMGVATSALLTDMSQPLGRTAGNAIEVEESIAVLRGGGPDDVRRLTVALGRRLLLATRIASSGDAARDLLVRRLEDGSALHRFEAMVQAQGGRLPAAREPVAMRELACGEEGFLQTLDTEKIGRAVIELGGGRRQLGDAIDHAVGLEMLVRLGDRVHRGEPWVRLFYRADGSDRLAAAERLLASAVSIGPHAVAAPELIVAEMEDGR